MKYKNNLLKKFIVTLAICVLLFNFIIPTTTIAWDIGGILFKPTAAFTLLAIDSTNYLLSSLLLGVKDKFFDDDGNLTDENLLMSPEMIFDGSVDGLNANIFAADDVDAFTAITENRWSGCGRLVEKNCCRNI